MQYLAGALTVDAGLVIPLQASHNTVGMRFDIAEADYLHLAKRDASFPLNHLHHLSDIPRHRVRPLYRPYSALYDLLRQLQG